MSRALGALFLRELRLARRIGGGAAIGVVFFLIMVTIVPFAIGPDLNLLSRIGPAVLWIAALLASRSGRTGCFRPISKTDRSICCASVIRRSN